MRMENLFEGVKVLGEFSSSRKALNFDLKLSLAYFKLFVCIVQPDNNINIELN